MFHEIEAVILAGGMGERMGNSARDRQKCLLPVEDKPILEHILDNVTNAFGSAKVIIATGYRGETVKEYFGSRYRNIDLNYVHNPDHLETKKRLLLAEEMLKKDFLFLAGDIIVHSSQLQKIATSFEKEKYNGILGAISGATKHEPAMSHALITVKDGHAEKLIFPPPNVYAADDLREMHIAYYSKQFLDILHSSPSSIKYISSVLSLTMSLVQNLH